MADVSDPRAHWDLDPGVCFLNHGSFGACPREVLAVQRELRTRIESEPVRFFVREYEPLLAAARASLAAFLGADPDDLVFVTNATTGVNTILRSLRFERGDEIVVTNHGYNACINAVRFVADRWGLGVVTAALPYPLIAEEQVVEAVLAAVGPATRLVLIDHVTSPTGLVLPVARLARELAERGVDVLVDGAHAPGMLPLDVPSLGVPYYTGNCHKWLCAPKGVGFLWVARDRQADVRPLTISHGANSQRTDRSRFLLEFDWTGTHDPSPALSLPTALEFIGSLRPGGWPAHMAANRQLALTARGWLCDALGIDPPCPDSMLGSLAAVPLPDDIESAPPAPLETSPLQERLWHEQRIEVPVMGWPRPPQRVLRISAQVYNRPAEYARLAELLPDMLAAERSGAARRPAAS